MEKELLKRYLLTLIKSMVEIGQLQYVAGCLNTGQSYYELLSGGGSFNRQILRTNNEKEISAFCFKLREQGKTVLDPGMLVIDEWSDRDIGDFFTEIIDKFVGKMWFLDGWEFSTGATKEFIFCADRCIECVDQRGVVVTRQKAIALVERAVAEVEALGLDGAKLRSRVRQLRHEAI